MFEYDTDGRLARVLDSTGQAYIYGYDSNDNLTQITYPDGAARTYHYGEFGAPADYLTGITDENGNRYATWKYDDQGRAVVSEHAGGAERTEIEYLDDGTVRVTDASGNERIYSLIAVHGRVLTSRIENGCSACGNASDWEYNDLGLITRKEDRSGNVTTYQYNEYGLETARTEAAGTADARTITTEWDTDLRLPLTVNEPGLRTEYTYDARGRRLSKTEIDTTTGERRTTTWSYHPDNGGVPGQLAAIDGPRADVTTFAYDAQGNRIRMTNALGHVTEITDHDARGRPLHLVDPNGLVSKLDYDARGRLVSRDVGGEVTTFAYDGVGNLVRIDLPDGSALQYEYDAAQRLVALADDEGHRIEYTLDAAGNRVEQNVRADSGTLVRTQRQVFDEFDRLIRTVGALGQASEHTYDDNGNRIATTDPAGDATQGAFDALDRLTQVTDPLGGITTYTYDRQDRITAVTDPNGNTTRYTYNGFGDRTVVDSPDNGVTTYETTYEHDAAGKVIAKTDARGQTTQYTYDALNRLVRTEYADGATVDYIWDEGANGIGRLSSIEETTAGGEIHNTDWQYDRHGRVLERSQTVDGLVLRTRHAYDSAGRRIETIYPSGKVVTYTHDTDELTGLSVDGETVITGADYQPFGPVAGWTWGDGDAHTRQYDLDGRLTEHGLATGSPGGGIRRLDYTVDDNIATITGPRLARNYGYDGLDRLIAANDPDRIDQYTYDANGNRTSRTEGTEIETYSIDAQSNRLLSVAGDTTVDYSHDPNGNLVDDSAHSYSYSARNRLIAVDGGDTARYRYNALGQRIHKTAGGDSDTDYAALAAEAQQKADEYTLIARQHRDRADYWWDRAAQDPMYEVIAESYDAAADYAEDLAADYQQQADEYAAMADGSATTTSQYFVYNDRGQLIGRYDESGNAIREYFHLGSLPVAVAANDELYYIHADHLGTPRAASEPNGKVIWSWVSDPFGDSEPNEDPDGGGQTFTLNLRFPGQYFDAETGKHYNYFRSYDPSLGRYATSDPIGLQGGLNTYEYVVNNPLNRFDPFGLNDTSIFDAQISLGLQAGTDVRIGAGRITAFVDAGSVRLSSSSDTSLITQGAQIGVGLGPFDASIGAIRASEQSELISNVTDIPSLFSESLGGQCPGSTAELGFPVPGPLTGGNVKRKDGDVVISIGAALVAGLSFTFIASEFARRAF